MICVKCREQDHLHCDDHDPVAAGKRKPKMVLKKGRYRSCDCQHVVKPVPSDDPLGDPSDC